MISIKVKLKNKDNNYNVEYITSCLNIIIAKYADNNGNLNDAVVFVPSKVYKIMSQKCSKEEIDEGIGVSSLFYDWVKLIEDKNLDDTLVIADKKFFNFSYNINRNMAGDTV